MENMKILVTGGLGLIGHNVAKLLESAGHDVVIMDNGTDYGIIPRDEMEYLASERIKELERSVLYRYDICDGIVDQIFAQHQFDTVIHLASFPRQKVVNADPIWGSRVMSEGLLNLCEASKRHKVKRFVYISSSMVYGDFVDQVTEDYLCKPQGQYGILKLAGEHLVKDYTRRGCFDYTIIRPSAVYGPLDVEDRVISKFLLTAMRGGVLKVNGASETLDFTFVTDAAQGIVQATECDAAANKTYNITKSHSRSLLDAAQLAVKIVGKGSIEVRGKDADFPSRGALDITAARRDFGFNPLVDVEEGFERYYQWLSTSSFWQSKL